MPFGERRVVATFTYGEQLSHFIANLLDREDKSSVYFQEKIEERKDEIPEELLKQREIQERKNPFVGVPYPFKRWGYDFASGRCGCSYCS